MKEFLVQTLEELGDDADSIARNLAREGCKGFPGNGAECPVARYLKKKGFSNPTVCITDIVVENNNNLIVIQTPLGVEDFLGDFDQGVYPELVETANVEP